jgi:endoglucanase
MPLEAPVIRATIDAIYSLPCAVMAGVARAGIGLATACAAFALAADAAIAQPDVIRVGGPSAPDERKIAIVASERALGGKRFTVRPAAGGQAVLRGRIRAVPGRSAPWHNAYRADLSAVDEPGAYRVRVGGIRSRPWRVLPNGSHEVIDRILGFLRANRDGEEPSPIHGPAHLNDAIVHPDSPVAGGEHIDITGGWMDAGDTLHFTQTTAFVTAVLEASARLDPAAASELEAEADVGVRWLMAAHPQPGLFIAQVADRRDHLHGFRDPDEDDASPLPGIGTRFAYHAVGGDLGGKTAAALALAYLRTGEAELLSAAEEWYAAGRSAARSAPKLRNAGYPRYAADFYFARNWKDSMAAGAAELYRATCAAGACASSYQEDFKRFARSPQSGAYAALGAVDDFASFAAAEACGAFGDASAFDAEARRVGCRLLRQNGRIAVRQARRDAFGMPGYYTWGTTAQNGAAGALAALATAAPAAPSGACRVAAGARDWLLGRNPYGASFVIGYGPRAPRHPHHWATLIGPGLPQGAVVGGVALRREVEAAGFRADNHFASRRLVYEDRRANFVTSEPGIDYAGASVLLLAALRAHC